MRSYIYLVLMIALVTVQGCTEHKEKMSTENFVRPKANPSFTISKVISDQPTFTVTLPGELLPYEQVSIYPKIKGFIKTIYVDRGSHVHKGQVLARLEAAEIGEQYAARQSSSSNAYQKYLFSKQTYQRLKEASQKSGAVATLELERAYAQLLGDSAAYQSSRSETAASRQIKNYLTITAPFSGVVTGRYVSEGALVGDMGKNEPLFQLAQQDKLRLTVAIPEKQAQSLPAGTKATFTVVNFPGKTFEATLSRNSGALDAASRSVITEFDIPTKSTGLRAGQYAKVRIELKRPTLTLWVPASSVVQAQSGIFVVGIKNNHTIRIPVQTGVSSDTLIEVFGNLQAGDIILKKGSEEIKEGMSFKEK